LRVIIAAASNGGGYANVLRSYDAKQGTGVLETVLAELWDFDTRISRVEDPPGSGNWVAAPQDYLQPDAHANLPAKPLRVYTQTPAIYAQGEAYFLANLSDDTRWTNYLSLFNSGTIPQEIPPLPPGPYNSTNTKDAPVPGTDFRHHLIRDFMFLDATVSNQTNNSFQFTPPDATNYTSTYHLVRLPTWPPVNDDPNLGNFTLGIGRHPVQKFLLNDSTFNPTTGAVEFVSQGVAFTALLYELRDVNNNVAPAPNWFGVAVPDGIADLRNVVIYFHPYPGQSGANYKPSDYPGKTGISGTNWKELYSYVDRLGNQLAGAAGYVGNGAPADPRNQIIIFPFMENYDDVGIFAQYWYFIVKDILDDIFNNGV
jgi:hypothetical protein